MEIVLTDRSSAPVRLIACFSEQKPVTDGLDANSPNCQRKRLGRVLRNLAHPGPDTGKAAPAIILRAERG